MRILVEAQQFMRSQTRWNRFVAACLLTGGYIIYRLVKGDIIRKKKE